MRSGILCRTAQAEVEAELATMATLWLMLVATHLLTPRAVVVVLVSIYEVDALGREVAYEFLLAYHVFLLGIDVGVAEVHRGAVPLGHQGFEDRG